MSDDFIGPVIPPQLLKNTNDEDEETNDLYGPVLPPSLKASESTVAKEKAAGPTIGPQLPAALANRTTVSQSSDEDDSDDDDDDDDGGFVIGPQPYQGDDNALHMSSLQRQFEDRADRMRKRLCGSEEETPAEREEWMIQPPPKLTKAFGLGPRKFNAKAAPVDTDNSLWTSVPGKPSQSKAVEKPEQEDIIDSTKDEMFTKVVDNFKKSKSESLMDIHKKNLKKQPKNSAPQERRPFDRDVDLDANRLDNAQRDAIVKRSRQLNDRFSAGKSKFL